MDKRRYPRIPINGLTADISDGKGFYSGRVSDISIHGLSLDEIHQKLDGNADILSVIVDGRGGRFRLLIKQKWEIGDGLMKTIGGQIENDPWDWAEFIQRLEPDQDKAWG